MFSKNFVVPLPKLAHSGVCQGKEGSAREIKHMRSQADPSLRMHTHAAREVSVLIRHHAEAGHILSLSELWIEVSAFHRSKQTASSKNIYTYRESYFFQMAFLFQ